LSPGGYRIGVVTHILEDQTVSAFSPRKIQNRSCYTHPEGSDCFSLLPNFPRRIQNRSSYIHPDCFNLLLMEDTE